MKCISLESDPLVRKIVECSTEYSGTHRFDPSGVMMAKEFEEIADKLKKMTVRPDDIWIVTFPKTGTTVTQEATWLLKNNFDFEKAKRVPLTFRSPFVEAKGTGLPEDTFPSIQYVEEMPSPRVIKSHLPFSLLPDALWTIKPKIIVTYRNPKDTVISYYHHAKLISGTECSFEDFAELFLANKYQYCPYWPMTLGLWEKRNETHVLFVLFKDISLNKLKFIRRLADFLQVPLSTEREKELSDHTSLRRMQSNPSVNYEGFIRARSNKEGYFVRSGKTDEWKETMSREMIGKFDEWSGRALKDTDFPYYC